MKMLQVLCSYFHKTSMDFYKGFSLDEKTPGLGIIAGCTSYLVT